MERKQFTFYSSFAKALSRIRDDSERAKAYDTIIEYAIFGIEPDLDSISDTVALAFELIKPTLDSSNAKSHNGQRIRSGTEKESSNTEPEAIQSEEKPKETETERKHTENKPTLNEKEGEKEKENECYISPPTPPRGDQPRKRFIPPTVEEVTSYCLERKNGVDPQRFVDFYASKGWKVGNQPMKDWRAAVRTWERTDSFNGKNKLQGRTYNPETVEEMSQFDVLDE